MTRFRASMVAWSLAAVHLMFFVVYWILPHERLLRASYALCLGVVFMVLVRWTANAWSSLREGRQGYNFLIVGVYATFVILFGQRIWAMVLDAYERAPFLTQSFIPSYIPVMFAWAGGLVLFAPDTEDGVISNKSYVLLVLAIFIAGALFGVTIATSILTANS